MRNHLFLLVFVFICEGLNAQTQLLGSPTTLVKNRGAFMSDSLLYIPKRTKAPSDSGAIRYNIADSSVYVWTGYQWRAVSASTGVYVPYTGATNDVDLGTFSLNAKSLHIKGTAGQGHLGLKHQTNTPSLSASESAIYANVNGDLAWHNDNLYSSIFKTSLTTANRTYTFQNKSYTVGDSADIALKVNISDTSTMLSPYIRAAGYGLTKSSQSLLVDTTVISTRLWRQKGDDSLGAITVKLTGGQTIAGNKTFSNDATFSTNANFFVGFTLYNPDVANGYNFLRSKSTTVNNRTINFPNDSGTVILDKTLSSYIGSSFISGTTNYVAKFTGTSAVGNSQIFDNGTNVGINTTSPLMGLQINNFGGFDGNGNQLIIRNNVYYNSSNARSEPIQNGYQTQIEMENIDGKIRFSTSSASNNVGTAASLVERMRITNNGEVLIATTSDLGAYTLQNSGAFYNTGSAILAATSGNVGIGTASPSAKLHVAATGGDIATLRRTDAGNALVEFTNATTTDDIINRFRLNSGSGNFFDLRYYGTSNYFGIDYGGNNRLAITSAGNVGIGTASPANKLSVNGAINALTYFLIDNSQTYLGDNGVIGGGAADGNSTLSWFSTKDLYFKEGASTRMTIKSGGELLINTTTDAGDYKLQVAGASYFNNPSNVAIQIGGGQAIRTTGTLYTDFGTSGSGDYLVRAGSGFSNAFAITNSGNVGIGTASPTGFSDKIVNVYGSASAELHLTTTGTGTANSDGLVFSVRDSDGIGQIMHREAKSLVFGTNDNERMRINSDGEVLIGSSTDQGAYQLQVAGSIYNTTGGVFSASSGSLLIGKTTAYNAAAKLEVFGPMTVQGVTGGQGLLLDTTRLVISQITNQSGISITGKNTGTSGDPVINASWTWEGTANRDLIYAGVTATGTGANSNFLHLTNGTVAFKVTKDAEIMTAAPTGGSTKKWKLGEAATVSPTSPNRTIRVEIDGTVYYIHAKTTND